jgi:folate-dependent phosphoribosylglycinamide formyltransferase PurN
MESQTWRYHRSSEPWVPNVGVNPLEAMLSTVMITGSGALAARVAGVVNHAFPDAVFIIEDRAPRRRQLRVRIRRHGLFTAMGQVAFRAVLARKMFLQSARLEAIWRAAGLKEAPVTERQIWRTSELNGLAMQAFLRDVRPAVVIIFAVNKLTPTTLAACAAPVLNLHPGITPAYRGVHSGYWALRMGDARRFGATVHLVDNGLDTGPIVDQIFCTPDPGDTIATYNVRLVVAGLDSLLLAAKAVRDGTPLVTRPSGSASPLFHEPTLWSYLVGGIRSKVW